MANNTADLDWVDCHDLRRDPQTGWNGQRGAGQRGDRLGAIAEAHPWRGRLRLIESDGSVIDVPPLSDSGAPKAADEARAKRQAEEKARKDAEAKAAAEAEEKTRKEAEAKAKKEVEAQAKRKAEEQARKEAEAKAKKEAEDKRKAEEKAKREAEAKAKAEAEEKARRDAEAKAQKEAEEKARREAEEKARLKAEEDARKAAEAKAKKEAEEKRKAEEKARKEAEAKAKKEAEAKAKAEAEAKRKAEEEARKKAEAEEKARKEAEEKAKREAEARAKREAEEKRKAEEKARKEAEAKREAEEKAKAKAKAEEKARLEAEAKARKEAEEKARLEEEAKAEAQEKARKEAEETARIEAEAKAKAEAEEKARQQAEAKAKAEADAKAEKEAAEKADREKRETAEKERQEALAKEDLGETFRRLIRETGPISLAQYMGDSNARYYASRDPLGEEGDFITAPEISQMFGELIGLWLADLWVKMGASDNIHYVELGPGRGTLSKDVLRTAGKYGFDPKIHFVEGSIALRQIQRQSFPAVQFHHDLSTLPDDRPLLIVANEFFDALPIHQLIRSANGWHERMVGLEGDEFAFVAGDKPMDSVVPSSWKSASQGSMIETSPAAATVMAEIAQRLKNQGGAALIIDYGPSELRAGSTLQALKDHKKVDPFAHPGEADLTAHVDFEMLQEVAEKNGAEVMGLQMQGEWLRQLHIDTRLEALQRKTPAKKAELQRQRDRLVEDDQMGVLFKVLGVCGRRWPHGEGFQ